MPKIDYYQMIEYFIFKAYGKKRCISCNLIESQNAEKIELISELIKQILNIEELQGKFYLILILCKG